MLTKQDRGGGKLFYELSFKPGSRLSYIHFQNYYCASVVVKQRLLAAPHPEGMPQRGPRGEASHTHVWKRVLTRTLMASVHHENDAQDWHCIAASDLNKSFEPDKLTVLRIYLFQPSPHWVRIELRHIQVAEEERAGEADDKEGLCDVDRVVAGGETGVDVLHGDRVTAGGARTAGLGRRLEYMLATARSAEDQLQIFRSSAGSMPNPHRSLSMPRSGIEVVRLGTGESKR